MVAEISGHNAQFIYYKMPLVQVYQFRTMWFQKHGLAWIPVDVDDSVAKMQ